MRLLCVLLFTVFIAEPSVFSQGLTGQIGGNVQDAAGAVVPGAEVKLTNIGNSATRTTTTDSGGDFIFAQLLPGIYEVSVNAKGFKRYIQSQIELTATERIALPQIRLQVGELAESITVEAEGARIQTQSAERSGLISTAQTQNIPLKGRDYLGLVKLLPGVVDTANREAPGWNNINGITINGNRAGTINLTLDGISSLDTGSMGGPYLAPSIDAVGEVKVLLTNYQAEYGRSSGGTINTIIKSGTREFHGGAYYFLRNEALNANEFFRNRDNLAKPRYRYNYPGYFIGGPIPWNKINPNREKLFFFWSQEFLPRTRPTSLARRTFPTQLERQGDFSDTRDQNGSLIPIWDPLNNRAPFPGNRIPANRIDANGQKLLSLFPLPNTFDPARTFNSVFQSTVNQPRREEILRVDWNIGSKTSFYARGIQNYEAFKGEFDFVLASSSWPQLPINYQIDSKGLVATLIHTFNPTLVNEFTFGVNRAVQTVEPLSQEGLERNQRDKVGLNLPQFFPSSNPSNLIPNANFGGVPNAGVLSIEQRYPFFGTNNIWNYNNNLSKIWARHNLKAGIYVEQTSRNAQRSAAFNGTFNFNRDVNNPLETNYAYSNAILGTVQSYVEATNRPIVQGRYVNVEWFVQDQWKLSRRFTLDFGIRFYWIQPTSSEGSTLALWDSSVYDRTKQPPLIEPYLNGTQRVGRDPVTGELLPAAVIGSFSQTAAPFQGMQTYRETALNNPGIQYAPRFGFGWDVFGNGKTAVRGGVGVFFDRYNDDQVFQMVEQPPNVVQPVATYTTIRELLATPLRVSPQNVISFQRDYNPPTVYNWSFGIQQSVGFGMVLDVAYVGNVARYMLHRRSLNAIPYGERFKPSSIDTTTSNRSPLPDNFLRTNPGYADIVYGEFASNSNYHSMQTQLNRRFSKGLMLGVAWTWSKSMNFVDANNTAVNPFLDFRDRNYGRASTDRLHNFVLNYVYNIPGLGKRLGSKPLGWFTDNWDISGITTFTSGAPIGLGYSLVQAQDVVGGGGAGVDSRVVILEDPTIPKSERSVDRHFNINSFRAPTKAELGIGTATKDPLRGPGISVFDVSFYKNILFDSEGARRLQLRFEFYNFFNHANFQGVENSGRFDAQGRQVNIRLGQYTSTLDARRIVLGVKFYF